MFSYTRSELPYTKVKVLPNNILFVQFRECSHIQYCNIVQYNIVITICDVRWLLVFTMRSLNKVYKCLITVLYTWT